MKKIIIVNGSPRKGGNSDVIAEKMAEQMRDADITMFRVREKNIGFCHGCDACKKKDKAECVQKDDMGRLIPEIDACDAIVVISPIYFGHLAAQAKTFLDRIYCFFDPSKPDMSLASGRGKKAAVILTCGAGDAEAYLKDDGENTAGALGIIGVDEHRTYVCSDVNAPGSCADNAEYMKNVAEIGTWIAE